MGPELPEAIERAPELCPDDDPTRVLPGATTRKELTTRKDVADLGNIEGSLIRRILEILPKIAGGYELFQRMGLARRPPDEEEYRNSGWRTLSRCLRSWSFKQVRTQFTALRNAGLINGERQSENNAWQYELPEALQISSSPFAQLPTAEELFAKSRT